MLHKIGGDALQPFVSRDDLVVLAQQLLQQSGLIWVQVGGIDSGCDAVIQVQLGQAQLFTPVLIHQLDGGSVFFAALEVVARHIAAKNALGDLVVLEQRRAGEADESRVGQCQPHVARQLARLGAVRLIRHHNDVVAPAVGRVWRNLLIELVNQAEYVGVVF